MALGVRVADRSFPGFRGLLTRIRSQLADHEQPWRAAPPPRRLAGNHIYRKVQFEESILLNKRKTASGIRLFDRNTFVKDGTLIHHVVYDSYQFVHLNALLYPNFSASFTVKTFLQFFILS